MVRLPPPKPVSKELGPAKQVKITRSKSRDLVHISVLLENGYVLCSCEGYLYKEKCIHIAEWVDKQ